MNSMITRKDGGQTAEGGAAAGGRLEVIYGGAAKAAAAVRAQIEAGGGRLEVIYGGAAKGAAAVRAQIERVREDEELRRKLRELVMLFPNLVKLLGRLAMDSRVPVRSRLFAFGVLAYVVSPIDLVPGFIPVLGQIDDLLAAALALELITGAAGPEVVREHWDGTDLQLAAVLGVVEWGAAALAPKPLRAALDRFLRSRP